MVRGKGLVANGETPEIKELRLAAEQGDAGAQLKLGDCYWSGEGVAEDKDEAVKWYRLAAEQGAAGAQLGASYYCGEGVAEDKAEAAQWFRRAAKTAKQVYAVAYQIMRLLREIYRR